MKKILNIIILTFALLLSFGFVNGSQIYQAYHPIFSADTPNSLYIQGGLCQDNSCSSVNGGIELFNGDEFIACWTNYQSNNNANQFLSCIDSTKLTGNVIDLSQMSRIVTKETVAPLGSIKQFFTSGDSYLPVYTRFTDIVCNFDICIDEVPKTLNFIKKDNAIAEIGQLNIMNLNNPLLPIQVQVPVSIDETVCSAFRYTNPNVIKFQPPTGYSDYSANTQITLNIENNQTGESYISNQQITIPIEADTCAGLGAFTWTPSANLENQKINFIVDTLVIDNQVSSSIPDYAQVTETIYPIDLSTSCWTASQDFTLSNNQADFTMTPAIVEIVKGETLFANFRAGAWIENQSNPINFRVEVLVDGNKVYDQNTTSATIISDYNIPLTNIILNYPLGVHTITLITTPQNSQCSISQPVIQTQKLDLIEPNFNTVVFHIKDQEGNNLDGVSINLNLLSADDNFAITPTYTNTLTTNIDGIATFNSLYDGNYNYNVFKNNYNSANNNVHIAGDKNIYLTIYQINSPPIIDLLNNYTLYYQENLTINLEDYISDFNDAFSDLTIIAEVISGVANAQIIGSNLIISTTQVGSPIIRITVTDTNGASANDITKINFINNNAPHINSFYATDDNGDAPFNTNFIISITDIENDNLICTIDFDDNTLPESGPCNNLNNLAHIFQNPGTYNVVLTVNDNFNTPVTMTEQIFVYQVQYSSPKIDFFTLDSSNQNHIPTNLTLTWGATHPDNLPITCSLRINGVAQNVICSDSIIINNYNILGTGTFTIIVTDSNGIQDQRTLTQNFLFVNNPPIINTFSANPNTGIAPLTTTFSVFVIDNDNNPLTCSLDFGDLSPIITDTCNNLNLNTHIYSNVGLYTAILTATDGIDNMVATQVVRVDPNPINLAPIINTFSANPNTGIAPLTTTFSILTTDFNGDILTCSLDFGDSTPIIIDLCSNLNGIMKTYSSVGNYVALLSVSDGINIVYANSIINVLTTSSLRPIISNFQIGTSNGNLLPSNLTFTYSAQDPTGLGMICAIDVNGIIMPLSSCIGTTNYNDYNISGAGTFTFSATNSAGTTNISRNIIFAFPNTVDLSLDMIELNMPSQIAPGRFDFNVIIRNETLAQRELYFMPKFVCNGVSNDLNTINGILDISVISKVEREEGFMYNLNSNTNDYRLIIPENTQCRFELTVNDGFGTDFVISKAVIVKLPQEVERIQSIRGHAVDITNYMSSVLSSNINKGYNSIEFNVENNEDTQKELVVTMTSRELNINYKLDINLAPGQQRAVLIPLYIDENSNDGLYSLRFSVYDGSDKQVRYSYIKIN